MRFDLNLEPPSRPRHIRPKAIIANCIYTHTYFNETFLLHVCFYCMFVKMSWPLRVGRTGRWQLIQPQALSKCILPIVCVPVGASHNNAPAVYICVYRGIKIVCWANLILWTLLCCWLRQWCICKRNNAHWIPHFLYVLVYMCTYYVSGHICPRVECDCTNNSTKRTYKCSITI